MDMVTKRMVLDPQENIKAKILRKALGLPNFDRKKKLIKWEGKFKEFDLRQLPTFNLATIEWILERKPTEVENIKHDLIDSWMACHGKCK